MLVLTIENVPGKKITNVVGLVKGSTIRAKHIGKDIGASFKQLVGGELTGYDEMLEEARKIAIGRMVEDAQRKGANAIIGFRLTSATVMQGAAEMLAYGTAVVIEDNE
ncbi:MAG: heavy metal-binding domain-containing protein [Romboutsia sp.]|uniref:YbjQ family protein n=1 Tax=Paraclostridium sp. TaxID=2023273 RepID=UPI003A9B67EA